MSAHLFTHAATVLCLVAGILSLNLFESGTTEAPSRVTVDEIIGEGGFNRVHPLTPGPGQRERLVARLAYIETLLRSRDVGDWPDELVAARMKNLDRLRDYRLRAIFPYNDAYPDEIRPCFIDRDGAICAVGYLIEQSAGRDFAEWINRRHQYATVAEMSSPALDAWIASSGLTAAEVRTIQEPGFNRSGGIEINDPFTGGFPSIARDEKAERRKAVEAIRDQIDSGRVARAKALADTSMIRR